MLPGQDARSQQGYAVPVSALRDTYDSKAKPGAKLWVLEQTRGSAYTLCGHLRSSGDGSGWSRDREGVKEATEGNLRSLGF